MFFRQIIHPERSCLSYLIGCQTEGVCAVIDPQGKTTEYSYLAKKNGMKITAVIETHIHADHYSIAHELAQASNSNLYYGPNAATRYRHETLQDSQLLEIGNRKILALHTPGHTPEHISLLVNDWFVLTGDTLFVGDVGRVDLTLEKTDDNQSYIKENSAKLYASLKRLLKLPDWTEIYAGHYGGSVCGRGIDGKPSSTIGREKLKSRPMQLSKEEFIRFQLQSLPPLPADFQTIKRFNLGE